MQEMQLSTERCRRANDPSMQHFQRLASEGLRLAPQGLLGRYHRPVFAVGILHGNLAVFEGEHIDHAGLDA